MSSSVSSNHFTGQSVPTLNYVNSLGENFPSPARTYKIDAGVSQRLSRDYLPINANLNTTSINDSYLEFIIHPSDREFINTENLFLEIKLKVKRANGEDLGDDSRVSVIDGLAHTLISRCTVYLNSTICESNNFKGLWEYIKTITTSGVNEERTILQSNYYRKINSTCKDTVNEEFFGDSREEKEISLAVRNGVHLMVPINLNISSGDFYLLDNVELRIRLDLNSSAYVLLSHQDTEMYSYEIQLAKLHVEKILPHSSALVSLNKTLLTKNINVEYVVDVPIIKTHVFPTGYTSLTLDDAFNGYIPNKVYIFLISQTALSGNYTRNPTFLQNCNISSLRLDVNGNVHSHLTGSFPNNITQYFIKTLMGLSGDKTLLTHGNFKSGRTLFAFDLSNSSSVDCINIQRKGNLRISLQTSSSVSENMTLFLVGMTNGTIFINSERAVRTSF